MIGSYVPDDVRNMIVGMEKAGLILRKLETLSEDPNQQFQGSRRNTLNVAL